MTKIFPATKEELLEGYPHLRPARELEHERFQRFASQKKQIPPSKNLAVMTNIRAHLKQTFPGQQFSVKENNYNVLVSWTKWEEPLGNSPDRNQVNEALEWFRNWPSDTTCNESRPASAFRSLFVNTFGGTHRFEYKIQKPTPEQLARKKKSKLGKIVKEAQSQSKAKPSIGRVVKM